jgi:hypothetical protein
MTDIQRWHATVTSDSVSFELAPDGMWMLYTDHLAAVWQAEQRGRVAALDTGNAEWVRGWKQGQRDMLARCIAAVEDVRERCGHGTWGAVADSLLLNQVLAALRALGGDDE